MKRFCASLAILLAAALFLAAGVQLAARATWSLSGAGKVHLQELASEKPLFHRWTAQELEQVRVHHVREWPAEKGRAFQEAPELAQRVARGELPPVAQRLPTDPLVIEPPDQCGPYGGAWVQYDIGTGLQYITWRLCYEELLRYDPFGREFLLNLLKSYEMSDEGRTWTLHLRRGIRWSDGEPFTADDYVFWYQDIVADANENPNPHPVHMVGGKLLTLEKLDDYSFRLHFATPNGLFLMHVATGGYRPVPAHYLKQFHPKYADPKELARLIVKYNAAGPYQLFDRQKAFWENDELPTLDAWIPQSKLTPGKPAAFVRNPYYWKVDPEGRQLPYIDRVLVYLAADRQTLNLKAINGQIGVQATYINLDNYGLLMEKSRQSHAPGSRIRPFSIRQLLGPNTVRLCINENHHDHAQRALLNDRRFRQALSLAIDRHEVNEVQFYGLGVERQFCPTSRSPYYSPEFEKAFIKYDPARANALLDELGLTARDSQGFRRRPDGSTLQVDIDSTPNVGFDDALQLVAQHWRQVGIKSDLRIRSYELSRLRCNAGLHDVAAETANGEQDPSSDLPCPTNRYSSMGWRWGLWFELNAEQGRKPGLDPNGDRGEEPSPEMMEVVKRWVAIRQTIDLSERVRLFREIYHLYAQNLWHIGLVGDAPYLAVVQDRFRNVPEISYYDIYSRWLANTAPECYAITPD